MSAGAVCCHVAIVYMLVTFFYLQFNRICIATSLYFFIRSMISTIYIETNDKIQKLRLRHQTFFLKHDFQSWLPTFPLNFWVFNGILGLDLIRHFHVNRNLLKCNLSLYANHHEHNGYVKLHDNSRLRNCDEYLTRDVHRRR